MSHYWMIGLLLGLSSGITPGPILALIFSETLRHGVKSGIKVAVAPLFTDSPIIFVSLYIFSRLSRFHGFLGIVAILGGLVLLYLGISNFRIRKFDIGAQNTASRAFTKGIAVNALNPHAYLFWFTVGALIAHKALEVNVFTFISFLVGFFGALVGTNILIAVLVGRTRHFIRGDVYKYIMWALGAGLCFLSILFFREGIGYFR